MWWDNWMSLGIIVSLLVYMAQRLASSMRPTIYASAASCRHIIALPWTNHEKGSFWIRSSVLFWNCRISQRATVPGWYFLVFFTFPTWRNSFQGALPSMVSQSFPLAGSSLPNIDGLASVAICWVSNDEGDLPTPSSCSASVILCMISSAHGGDSLAGVGGAPGIRAFSVSAPPLWPPSSIALEFCHLSFLV